MPEERLPVARVLLAGLAIAGGIGVAIGVVFAILATHDLPPGGPVVARPAPPAASQAEPSTLAQAAPALETAPQPELARFRADKARALDELAWADATRTTAHVPIRMAMAVMVARSASASASRASRAAEAAR